MTRASHRAISLVLLSFSATACYTTYTGIYWLEAVHSPREIQFNDLRHSVAIAIQEFGFREFGFPEFEDQVTAWIHTQGTTVPATAYLRGVEARVTVAVDDRPLSITIRDHSNRVETEFVRTLKGRIERRLETDLGVRGLRFKRQLDLFG